MSVVSTTAEHWARIRNVETLYCWLPGWNEVLDGTHIVTAVGNDGMTVNITIDTEMAQAAMEDYDSYVVLTQLAWLGKWLARFRAEDACA